jgi:hypothetical protein
MNSGSKTLVRIMAALAFLFCLSGGLWILVKASGKEDALFVGMGLYFVGKAFFVGPMLWVTAENSKTRE